MNFSWRKNCPTVCILDSPRFCCFRTPLPSLRPLCRVSSWQNMGRGYNCSSRNLSPGASLSVYTWQTGNKQKCSHLLMAYLSACLLWQEKHSLLLLLSSWRHWLAIEMSPFKFHPFKWRGLVYQGNLRQCRIYSECMEFAVFGHHDILRSTRSGVRSHRG